MLSIIVPIYNCNDYIEECLMSVVKLYSFDFECIVIDDGSTDNSGEIADAFAKKYYNIKVIHTENRGVSIARNKGLEIAEGEYIMFLDGDDYLTENADILINNALKNIGLFDIYVFEYCSILPNNKRIINSTYNSCTDSYTESIKNLAITSGKMNSCWGKIFNRFIIEKNNIRFNISLKVGEDSCFIMEYLKYANNIKICNKPLVEYHIHKNSIMSNCRFDLLGDISQTLNSRTELIKHFGFDKSLLYSVYNYYFNIIITYSINDIKRYSRKSMNLRIDNALKLKHINMIVYGVDKKHISKYKRLLLFCLKNKKYKLYYTFLKIYDIIKR